MLSHTKNISRAWACQVWGRKQGYSNRELGFTASPGFLPGCCTGPEAVAEGPAHKSQPLGEDQSVTQETRASALSNRPKGTSVQHSS